MHQVFVFCGIGLHIISGCFLCFQKLVHCSPGELIGAHSFSVSKCSPKADTVTVACISRQLVQGGGTQTPLQGEIPSY